MTEVKIGVFLILCCYYCNIRDKWICNAIEAEC